MMTELQLGQGVDNYAVLGNPVTHSRSPRIHQLFAGQTGESIHYQAILVPENRFEAVLRSFRDQGGKGLNVTVPFKQQACGLMDQLTRRAERAGSVNTIWFDPQGRACGDTTDGTGLIRDLARNRVEIGGKRLLILGAGGAVRGVLGELLAQGPDGIVIANRTPARARELCGLFPGPTALEACDLEQLQAAGRFDLIINAIPIGLTAELPALPAGLVDDSGVCYDMVYGETETPFVTWARARGARLALDGLGMLVEQAAESFYLWRGVLPETVPVLAALRAGD